MRRRKVWTSARWVQRAGDMKRGTLYLTASVRMFGTRFSYTLPLHVNLDGLRDDVKRFLRKARDVQSRP